MLGSVPMEKKTIRITGKRQITIPQKYFEEIGFGKEAECVLRNNEIVIRPIRENSNNEFAEQILEELISKGYSGKELLDQFKAMQKKIRPAIDAMLKEAANVANGEGVFSTYEDIFGAEE